MRIAQLAEHWTSTPGVVGSWPTAHANLHRKELVCGM